MASRPKRAAMRSTTNMPSQRIGHCRPLRPTSSIAPDLLDPGGRVPEVIAELAQRLRFGERRDPAPEVVDDPLLHALEVFDVLDVHLAPAAGHRRKLAR